MPYPLRLLALAGALTLGAMPARAQQAATDRIPDAAAPREAVAHDQVVALLGVAVRAQDGAELGRIVDVLVNAAGEPRAVVVDVGGFLGMGNRKVAVEWRALRFALAKTPYATLPLAPERIKSAPAYDAAKPVELVTAPPAQAAGP